jgi:hypothetical protein
VTCCRSTGRCNKTQSLRMPQERFSRGGAPFWYPRFPTTRILEVVFRASTLLENFAAWKTVWTLPSVWTHRTRPQVTWKTAKSAVFHSVHTDHFFFEEEKRNEEELQVCQSDCLNRGVHPSGVCLNCAYRGKSRIVMPSTVPNFIGRGDWIRTSDPLRPSATSCD